MRTNRIMPHGHTTEGTELKEPQHRMFPHSEASREPLLHTENMRNCASYAINVSPDSKNVDELHFHRTVDPVYSSMHKRKWHSTKFCLCIPRGPFLRFETLPSLVTSKLGLIFIWFAISIGQIIQSKELLSENPQKFWNKITFQHPAIEPEAIVVVPLLLSLIQCATTCILGGIKVLGLPFLARYGWADKAHLDEYNRLIEARYTKSKWQFVKDMVGVGILRAGSMLTGFIALREVAASFEQCMKSSQPLFTVVVTYLMLRQPTKWYVTMTLVPVVLGLAVASFSEISFTKLGLVAAMANSIIHVVSRVYSKKLTTQGYSAAQLQFFTSISATAIQFPFLLIQFLRGDPEHPGVSIFSPLSHSGILC